MSNKTVIKGTNYKPSTRVTTNESEQLLKGLLDNSFVGDLYAGDKGLIAKGAVVQIEEKEVVFPGVQLREGIFSEIKKREGEVMKKKIKDLLNSLDDAADARDDARFQDLLNSFYEDGSLHEILKIKTAEDSTLKSVYRSVEDVFLKEHKNNTSSYEDGYLDGLETAMNIIYEAMDNSK